MNNRKWFDSSQPQTLQGAVVLLYLNCFWALLSLIQGGVAFISLLFFVALAFGALGIANSSKAGYRVAVVISILLLLWTGFLLYEFSGFRGLGILNLLFDVALVAMVLHPQSREYQKIWFK